MQSYSNTLDLYRAVLSDSIIATLIELETVADCINTLAKLELKPEQILAAEAIRADLLVGAVHDEWSLAEFRILRSDLEKLKIVDFMAAIQTKHLYERLEQHKALTSRKHKSIKLENWHTNMDEILQDSDNREITWVNISAAKHVSKYVNNRASAALGWLLLNYSNDLTLHPQDDIIARVLDQEKITGILLYDNGFNRTLNVKQKKRLHHYLDDVANGQIAKLFGKTSLKLVFLTSMTSDSDKYKSYTL